MGRMGSKWFPTNFYTIFYQLIFKAIKALDNRPEAAFMVDSQPDTTRTAFALGGRVAVSLQAKNSS